MRKLLLILLTITGLDFNADLNLAVGVSQQNKYSINRKKKGMQNTEETTNVNNV